MIPILLAAGIIARFTLASFYVGIIVSDALYFTAFALIGIFVLRQSDDEWELPQSVLLNGVRMLFLKKRYLQTYRTMSG